MPENTLYAIPFQHNFYRMNASKRETLYLQYLAATEFPHLKGNFNCASMPKMVNVYPDGLVEDPDGMVVIFYNGCL